MNYLNKLTYTHSLITRVNRESYRANRVVITFIKVVNRTVFADII